jgi:hypothetical protein
MAYPRSVEHIFRPLSASYTKTPQIRISAMLNEHSWHEVSAAASA